MTFEKNKTVVIGVSALILLAMVAAVESASSVQSICQQTDYKETCEENLGKVAGNASAPNELLMAGFEAAIQALQNAINNSATIKAVAKDKMAKQALANCKTLMNTAIADLRASIKEVGDINNLSKIDELLDNIKIWLSATITYQQTCIDGFDNTTGIAGKKMKEILLTSSQLSSNGLAMVSSLSSIISDFNLSSLLGGRKLLSLEDEPIWISPGKKRLLAATPATIKADITVAQDGSGQYKTINEAIKKIPNGRNQTFVIYVKAGVYKEKIAFDRALTHVMLIGDGPTKTKITGADSFASGVATLMTATVSVSGDHFIAKGIGFENTAGPLGHQAVALKVQSDNAIFYNCDMNGYQNTLYAHTYRQFYHRCRISGTIDMVFGDAAAVFQNCTFVIRKPIDLQKCTITAQQRNDSRQTSGFVLLNSTITALKNYIAVREINPAFLGRPQNPYSRTIVIHSTIENVIDPKGWLQWFGTYGTDTCYYAEFENKGPGADTSKRVTWKGVKKINAQEAVRFSAGKFIEGDSWIKSAGIPYNSGI